MDTSTFVRLEKTREGVSYNTQRKRSSLEETHKEFFVFLTRAKIMHLSSFKRLGLQRIFYMIFKNKYTLCSVSCFSVHVPELGLLFHKNDVPYEWSVKQEDPRVNT